MIKNLPPLFLTFSQTQYLIYRISKNTFINFQTQTDE